MSAWARFSVLCLLAAPASFGTLSFPILSGVSFGLPGVSDHVIYYALFFNLMLLIIVGHKHYLNILTISVLCSLTILIFGPAVRAFYQSPDAYSSYYIGKFLTMMTVVPAALAIILSIPVNDLEQKLLAPGASKRRWRKALIISVRVIRHVIFNVIPSMKEQVMEEAIPYRCISQIWKRDRQAGRPVNAVLNVALFIVQFTAEIMIYAIGASIKNVDLWANWVSQVAAHVDVNSGRKELA